MSTPRISYYAHHVGSGHLRHARKIIETGVCEVQVASTGPKNVDLLPEDTHYVALNADVHPRFPQQPVAGEYLHYAPSGAHIAQRFATLNQAWKRFAPDLVMVDVSVEVALFAKLSGYRVALRRMPGLRTDRAHAMAYDIADALFAYFPRELEDHGHLEHYAHKSRYLAVPEPQAVEGASPAGGHQRGKSVVVQTSLGASIGQAAIARAAAASPEWTWDVLGSVHRDGARVPENLRFHSVVSNPAPWMADATVVITSAGHNAVMAAAASGRPVILIPEERPFAEQRSFAQMLHRATGCLAFDSWDSPVDWNAALEQAAGADRLALSRALFITRDEFGARLQDLVGELAGR